MNDLMKLIGGTMKPKLDSVTREALELIGSSIDQATEFVFDNSDNPYLSHLAMAMIHRIRNEYDQVLRSVGLPDSRDNRWNLYEED